MSPIREGMSHPHQHPQMMSSLSIVNTIKTRVVAMLSASDIDWLNNKSVKVRLQTADLTTRLAVMIKQCGEVQLLSTLGLILFEQLGKEYPDTQGVIALKWIHQSKIFMNIMSMVFPLSMQSSLLDEYCAYGLPIEHAVFPIR
ncbi:uncharacterized protein EDB91DRAFT_1080637 [Suillus paluster]|uniref:uncharacterized protein n=1 Tax=Suillus paluster TaxID=48578 RepID=UPI001B876E99|nr:uncharacterized protein EDB91DRAFT_1080637 [Suillus paluster]KAG1744522.1 hypothetical protein EDB91DRAFT_1080637 [Suillus paluster]